MADAGADRVDRVWEMSISAAEFERSLPLAVGVALRAAGPLSYEWGDERQGGRTQAVALTNLCIASLSLPRHRVSLQLNGYGAGAAAFLQRWDLHFRRGGG